MNQLKLSADLSLPIDAATQTFAFIARKGAGKTYAAGKLAECLMDAGVQVVILDSVGNWWGLRLEADGKSSAYDIPVIGGLRGDIPLEATGGHLIADTIVETGRSLIIDVSQFSKHDRQRIATDLGERLWLKKKAERHPSPLFLIIEEAQLIVPQRVDGSNARMVGIFEEIIRLGRNYGIGIGMISQRPQSVNKEVLNQTECLVCLQVNGKQERIALRDWIAYHGAEKSLVDELPSLPIGTAYIWSPQWLQILKKVKIGQKKTFDASATPKVGTHQIRRDLKPLKLDDLQERMAATIEKAKAVDPKELNKTISELRAHVRKLESAKPQAIPEVQTKVEVKKIEKRVVIESSITRLEKLLERAEKAEESLRDISTAITGETATIAGMLLDARKINAPFQEPSIQIPCATHPAPMPRPLPAPPMKTGKITNIPARLPVETNGDISGPMQKILNELAELEAVGISPADKAQLGLFCGYTNIKSGGFTGPLGKLREAELIHYPGSGEVALTDAGRTKAAEPGEPLTQADLQTRILGKLDGPRAKVLRQLIKLYPDSINKETLGGQLGYTNVKSGGFTGPLGSLRKLGLIEYPQSGTVAATVLLFPPGLS